MIDSPRFTAEVFLEDAEEFVKITTELNEDDEVPYRVAFGQGEHERGIWMSDKDLAQFKKGLAELQRRRKAG